MVANVSIVDAVSPQYTFHPTELVISYMTTTAHSKIHECDLNSLIPFSLQMKKKLVVICIHREN